jgi:transposase
MDIWEVIRRWHDRQSFNQIAQSLGYDRKTIRGHINYVCNCGLSLEKPLPSKEEILQLLKQRERAVGRASSAQDVLAPYLDEIVQLVNDQDLGLKPKSAFLVICERHQITDKVSYTSFKRFVASHRAQIDPLISTCRLEVPPGAEAQIDYAKVGFLFDPVTSRRRTLYVFIGTLSHSRFKYVEVTFSQDQTSFACSHVRMFEFFGGVPERLIIDNLKSGVIKPDLYDPRLNRTYSEMAEHYACFIDPARVKKPKDKAKVERDVQTVREAVRRTIVLTPTLTVGELNHAMKDWMHEEYGQHLHGTTHEKPAVVFAERERPALKPLPAEAFEACVWKQATVHPDHYIQFRGKAFSVPSAYVTKKVWIRASEHLLKIFYDERLVAQHVITSGYRHTDHSHFPENVRAVLDTSTVHQNLLERAAGIGADFQHIIAQLFELHAHINLRRAQGLVTAAEEAHNPDLVNRAAGLMHRQHIKATPRDLRCLLEKLRVEDEHRQLDLALVNVSQEFVRDISYFIHTQQESIQ